MNFNASPSGHPVGIELVWKESASLNGNTTLSVTGAKPPELHEGDYIVGAAVGALSFMGGRVGASHVNVILRNNTGSTVALAEIPLQIIRAQR